MQTIETIEAADTALADVIVSAAAHWYTSPAGNRFYFDKNGNKVTGWQMIDGKKYYFRSSGVMQTMWATIGGKKYYFGKTGVMRTMWETIGGKKYYFGKTGVMRTMWETIGGKQYYFGKSGVMRTGWETIGGQQYYFGENGELTSGASQGSDYVLNTETKKFHYPDCPKKPTSNGQNIHADRNQLIAQGYSPCGICKP